MHIVSHHTYTPGTWAGGTIRAIWADPADAIGAPASARCWAGTAVIERNAPYSFFAGRYRLHLPIRGQGLLLQFRDPAEATRLARGEPYCFDGERPLDASLVDGPVVAFNLIYRADASADAMVASVGPQGLDWPLAAPAEPGAAAHVPLRFVYSIAGSLAVRAGDEPPVTLWPDDTLVVPAQEHAARAPQLRLTSTAATAAEVVLATVWLPGPSSDRQ